MGGRVALGIVAADAATTNRRLGQGFQMVVSNAPALLARAARELLTGVDRSR